MLEERYKNLLNQLDIQFNDYQLLDLAFIHKSYVNEHHISKVKHNERLEFLGDAVLELIVTKYLYLNYPQKEEGDLTNWRSALVKGQHLAIIANDLGLGVYLYLSKGEERSGGRKKNYILANTVEALIGAIYLDQGYESAENFIVKYITSRLDYILKLGEYVDAKSKFQEKSQEIIGITPDYRFISETGPDHQKEFIMALFIGEEKIAEGKGSSKQKAEQQAAINGLKVKGW